MAKMGSNYKNASEVEISGEKGLRSGTKGLKVAKMGSKWQKLVN